jgi:hypothetical protein
MGRALICAMSVTLGHGLSNMHTRVHKVGGEVKSLPGEAKALLCWPGAAVQE